MTPLRNRRIHSAIASLALTSLAACAHARGAALTPIVASTRVPTTAVIVVRHAEKAPLPADDPVLSDVGSARAQALDASLRSTPITDVVVSHLQRTRLTAAPLILRTGAAIHVVPIGPTGVSAHVQALADTVRAIARGAGRGVLVVGHSNTVNLIVQALGGSATPALCDSQYSQLFTLRVGDGQTTVERSTYGAADPVDASCAAMRASPQGISAEFGWAALSVLWGHPPGARPRRSSATAREGNAADAPIPPTTRRAERGDASLGVALGRRTDERLRRAP